jgi:hypothetical protein
MGDCLTCTRPCVKAGKPREVSSVKTSDWTSEWPTEDGYYWMHYTWASHTAINIPPDLGTLCVRQLSGHPVYIMDGGFVYKREFKMAWFMRIPIPELPKE